ncbi:hypothetical protein [Chondromyces crocatus]|uniref:Uncharacterized protein n=1 Tax=Chondromyces crocatus TaxID=52 RepID=A0A0K1E7Z6_CHOCO|nr:hypothetical protein [Chondromyces crocatus]AKT37006.1 uncharacterized protein CMC5_011320 [Chondromyces crocatus]
MKGARASDASVTEHLVTWTVAAPEAHDEPPTTPHPVDLTAGRADAAPLWLLPSGALSHTPSLAPRGTDAREALVTAARWISSRRQTGFERLFPTSSLQPSTSTRPERLSARQGAGLLTQVRGALEVAAVGGPVARRDVLDAAQIRSAGLTVLSHLVATALRDPSFTDLAEEATAEMLRLLHAEQDDETARPALRAHAIHLLQLRAPALTEAHRRETETLVRRLLREAPPYAELRGPWNFAICSASEFVEGENRLLVNALGFREIALPEGTPPPPTHRSSYRAFEAPFTTPAGQPIRLFVRTALPRDEHMEMGSPFFTGLLINRHAQLGAFDMRAATVRVLQAGYKLMMNSQCAGLTTRFAISRMFPDADIYSSWDSTYFKKDAQGEVSASEGLDCFLAVLEGMRHGETHEQISERIRKAQWRHPHQSSPGFVQFVGPSHPLVVARYSDVNQDGRADYYDGFLDFHLTEIAEDVHASLEARDPGVLVSQVSGEAAHGLSWAAGSLNRVAQYSELWVGLPGLSELFYPFHSGGFYSHREPPEDVPTGTAPPQDLDKLPALVRFLPAPEVEGGFVAEVLFHSFLSHAAKEVKSLLCAADALRRALDLGYLPAEGPLASPAGQRGALLLTLAGLLEVPAAQNVLDGLWSMTLTALALPEISRNLVRRCVSAAEQARSNVFGSARALEQLLSTLKTRDPVAHAQLASDDPFVGRLQPMRFG